MCFLWTGFVSVLKLVLFWLHYFSRVGIALHVHSPSYVIEHANTKNIFLPSFSYLICALSAAWTSFSSLKFKLVYPVFTCYFWIETCTSKSPHTVGIYARRMLNLAMLFVVRWSFLEKGGELCDYQSLFEHGKFGASLSSKCMRC